jgi:hypothetical protein
MKHMMKRWAEQVALAATVGAALLSQASAPVAAQTCPAPGTGLPGALNMAAGGDGMAHAMSVDAPQGNAGMFTAVANSACGPATAQTGQAVPASGPHRPEATSQTDAGSERVTRQP